MSIDNVIIVVIGSLLSAFMLTLAWKLWASAALLGLELDDPDEQAPVAPSPSPSPSPVAVPVAASAPHSPEEFDKARTQFFVVAKDNERTEILSDGIELLEAERSPPAPSPERPQTPPAPKPQATPSQATPSKVPPPPPRVPPPPPLRHR